MISRVRMRKSGLAKYLKDGEKKGSKYNRDEKDKVIPLYGSLEDLQRAEDYANKYKEWEENYEHIVVSLSKEDMNRLENLSKEDYEATLKSIAEDYIKHRTSGYDLQNEVIAYAEAHEPKIKYETNSRDEYKERLTHIHIGISYLNALSNTKLRTTFYNNSYISDVLDKYVAKKNNLTYVKRRETEKDNNFFNVKGTRERLKEVVASMNDVSDLKSYLEAQGYRYFNDKKEYDNYKGLKYRSVETKFKDGSINNKYLVATIPNLQTRNNEFRFTGRGFEKVAEWKKGKYLKLLEDKSLKELEEILLSYYNDRTKLIDSRRSQATKKMLEAIYTNENNKEEKSNIKVDLNFINKAINERDNTSKKETNLKQVAKDLNSGKNVFLTGGAGVGKSYLTKEIIKHYEKKGQRVARLGSTGIAAQNIGGMTIHTFFNTDVIQDLDVLKKRDKNKDLKRTLHNINDTDLIVIDEISMVSDTQMEMIEYRLKQANFKGKILLVGDFQQLPPVQNDYSFKSKAWKNLNINTHQLHIIKRSDDKEFSELLNRCRYGKLNDKDNEFLKSCETKQVNDIEYTYIFSTNAKVKEHNERMIKKVANGKSIQELKTKVYTNRKLSDVEQADILKQTNIQDTLLLTKNVPVLITINDIERGIANGQRAIFKGIDIDKRAVLELEDGKKIKLDMQDQAHDIILNGKKHQVGVKQYPLKTAFAITIHKSQGMSIDNLAVDPNDNFANNQFYVAISRAKNPTKLKLLKNRTEHYQEVVKTDEEVLKFYHPSLKDEKIKAPVNDIEATYQQKLFYRQYGHLLNDKLKGYFIKTQDENVVFEKKSKSIKVVDKGEKIESSTKSTDIAEEVKLMLDLCEAKEWNLATITINGSDKFIAEAKKQQAQRLQEKDAERFIKDLTRVKNITAKDIVKEKEKVNVRTNSEVENLKQKEVDKQQVKKETKNIDLKDMKENLNAQEVLKYAAENYNINVLDYIVTDDNKINNLNNRQKPRNVIDFLQKEINLSTSESIIICKELYKKPYNHTVKGKDNDRQNTNNKERINTQRSRNKDLYKSVNRANERGREAESADNMRKLSESGLVKDIKRTEMLLSNNQQSKLDDRGRNNTPYQVRRASNSNSQSSSRNATSIKEVNGALPMSLKLSISDNLSDRKGLRKWRTAEINNYVELATLMKKHPYSMSIYGNNLTEKRSERHQQNIKAYCNVLIYDIDNDPNTPQLTIKQAEALLKKHNISAMILPSKSHQIEKFTESGKSKGIADRYRIIIPTNKSLDANIFDKEHYTEFQNLATMALQLDKYIDRKALSDTARFYHPSKISAVPTLIEAKRVMNIDKLQSKAIENIKLREAQKQIEQARVKEVIANIDSYTKTTTPKPNIHNLSSANVGKIQSVPVPVLIKHFEKIEAEYKEGSYDMIKTNNAKYSILENGAVAYNFKSEKALNTIDYMKLKLCTTNLNVVARELEKITGYKYIEVNIDGVKEAVSQARLICKNDKSFEENIKNYFNVKYCKLEKRSIKIADREILLKDLQIEKSEIIDDFRKNREKEKTKTQPMRLR